MPKPRTTVGSAPTTPCQLFVNRSSLDVPVILLTSSQMTSTLTRAARFALKAMLPMLLSACGGGGSNQAAAVDNAQGSEVARTLSASAGSPSNESQAASTTLTIRASGTVAGNIGPQLLVRIDGADVGTVEVRTSEASDYNLQVPPLRAGSKVDVVYTNDGSVGGVDRNVFVSQLTAGNTYVLPTSPGAYFDRGTGIAAFDGKDTAPGQAGLYVNGALRLMWPEPNMTDLLTVRAKGLSAGNIPPQMVVRVNNIIARTLEVAATELTDYVIPVPNLAVGIPVDIALVNADDSGVDKPILTVGYAKSGVSVLLPTAENVIFDKGSSSAAFDGKDVEKGHQIIRVNGALRGRWPAANLTDTVTLRAKINETGAAPQKFEILQDGIVLGAATLRSQLDNFTFPSLPIREGSVLELIEVPRQPQIGGPLSVQLEYALSGKTLLRGADAVTTKQLVPAAAKATWPSPNLTERLTVRAKADLAGSVGAIMELRVDGVVLGTAEAKSAEWADYYFAVPSLRAGANVDVAFINDGTANGSDRNLYVAYLASGNTFIRADAPENKIDRGVGEAAFDNVDVQKGGNALYWPAALRTKWPVPNITATVTVRASAAQAENVGAIMRLWVDGVAVSSVELKTLGATDYEMAAPTLAPGNSVHVTFEGGAKSSSAVNLPVVSHLFQGATVVKPNTNTSTYKAGNLQTTWSGANFTDSLVVRAYGELAGDIGPMMKVVVDDVVVGNIEVRERHPKDYTFSTPPIKTGAKVEVVYTNDGAIAGADRNLIIIQLKSKDTVALPNNPGSVIDRGNGEAAFDGNDLIAGQGGLFTNGALRINWPTPNLTDRLTVRASAKLADNVGAMMDVRVNGIVVGTTEVRNEAPADHLFLTPPIAPGAKVDIAYTNAGTGRLLNVHYVLAKTTVLFPSEPGNAFDPGAGLAAYDAIGFQEPKVALTENGALRAKWPVPNMLDTLTVRATAAGAGGDSSLMEVRLNGVVLAVVDVGGAPSVYTFAAPPVRAGAYLEIEAKNTGVVGAPQAKLQVDYAMSGRTVFVPSEHGSVTASTISGKWPEVNLNDALTIRAKGTIAGGVGPIIQVLVDGIPLGFKEIRGIDPADYTFDAPKMLPGRKVDVIYTNDASVGGVDRNLFIDYVLSGATFVRGNDPGAVIDRGVGASAIDGKDVIPSNGALYWSSAWRASWPQPNITGQLLVRAKSNIPANVGSMIVLRVDGVSVSAAEVRSTAFADYILPVPALRAGSKVDLVFTNDGIGDAAGRILQIAYLRSGNTYVLPTMPGVKYDLGSLNAAFDDVNVLAGRGTMDKSGALRMSWPGSNITDVITVRASASLADNIGAMMELRVDGVSLGVVEVRAVTGADYRFAAPSLQAGSILEIVYSNDVSRGGQDRNLYVQYISAQGRTLIPSASGVVRDYGRGDEAFDGKSVQPGDSLLATDGSLRFVVPAVSSQNDATRVAKQEAARLLMQAGFGPSWSELNRVSGMSRAAWLEEQMALPAQPDFVNAVQQRFDLGDSFRPGGANYTPAWVSQRFWQSAATSPDVLRKRVALALHHLLMVSMTDGNMYHQARAYANYLDILNRNAFGNYRVLLEQISLTPAMGIYLSHMRNRPGDTASGRMPDENFAREIMQLFSIGLHELNVDGTPKLDGQGNFIETYTNDDVMALARVFTGYSWAFPDGELSEAKFRWGNPSFTSATDQRIDLKPMRNYPGMHATGEKRIFAGKANAVSIAPNTPAAESLRLALDGLFNHPNVGPFVAKQLIQRLVSSDPSPAYVARVASVFNNNGAGVRGDLGAVVRAILLDAEAVSPPAARITKLREPILRVANWLRSFDATSQSGQWQMAYELEGVGQNALYAPSVFGYFRPGYVPPNTIFSVTKTTVPEMQVVNESTTAQWVNLSMAMAGEGVGWTGSARDVRANLQALAELAAQGAIDAMIDRIDMLLYAGRMSATLKREILLGATSVTGSTPESNLNRARVAVFLALASPEYMVQP